MNRRNLLKAAIAMLGAAPMLNVHAAEFPERPVRLIVPWNAGTATDTMARLIAERFTDLAGQPMIVENKPGASGTIGTQDVLRAAPDGYTLLTTSNAHIANPFLIRNLSYDPVRDFTPVAMTLQVPLVFVVSPKLGVRTLDDLTRMAKDKPGGLSFGAGSSGALIGMEYYKQLAGVNLLHVPYKSNTLAMNDLLGGHVDAMVVDVGLVYPQIQSGNLIALAVTGPQRAISLPKIPTMQEAGVKGYELLGWGGIWAPAGLPEPVLNRLQTLLQGALKDPRIAEFAAKASGEIVATTAQQFADFQRQDVDRWRRITQAAKIEPQ